MVGHGSSPIANTKVEFQKLITIPATNGHEVSKIIDDLKMTKKRDGVHSSRRGS
jgi:hypothetical protein